MNAVVTQFDTISIRLAETCDLSLMLDAFELALRDSHHSPITDGPGAARFIRNAIENHFVLIAEAHGRVIALVVGDIGAEEWSTEQFLDIRLFWIEPGYRGSKIAYEFFLGINAFADLNRLDVSLGIAGREMSERMTGAKGIRGEYHFVGGCFVRRQRHEEKGS